jgi:hypothetical protein
VLQILSPFSQHSDRPSLCVLSVVPEIASTMMERPRIHRAVSSGDHVALLELLQLEASMVDQMDGKGRTPLACAAEVGQVCCGPLSAS